MTSVYYISSLFIRTAVVWYGYDGGCVAKWPQYKYAHNHA